MMKIKWLVVPYPGVSIQELATHFFQQKIAPTKELVKLFKLILNHMEAFEIKNNEIDNLKPDKKGNLQYSLYAKDLLGRMRLRIVIKKLKSVNHTYEIRLDEEYYNHRILFFFTKYNDNNRDFFILSFGFSKTSDSNDLTNSLAMSTDLIKDDILLNKNSNKCIDKWLGVNQSDI